MYAYTSLWGVYTSFSLRLPSQATMEAEPIPPSVMTPPFGADFEQRLSKCRRCVFSFRYLRLFPTLRHQPLRSANTRDPHPWSAFIAHCPGTQDAHRHTHTHTHTRIRYISTVRARTAAQRPTERTGGARRPGSAALLVGRSGYRRRAAGSR